MCTFTFHLFSSYLRSWLYLTSTMGHVNDPLERCNLLSCRTVLSWSSSSYLGPPSPSALYSSVRYVPPGGVLAPGMYIVISTVSAVYTVLSENTSNFVWRSFKGRSYGCWCYRLILRCYIGCCYTSIPTDLIVLLFNLQRVLIRYQH